MEFDKSDSIFPVRNPIYRKDSYSPSKNEYKIIKKIIKSIRERDYSMSIDRQNDMPNNKAENDIWNDSVYVANDREKRRIIHDLPAPKLPLPKSDESYNPPPHLIPSESVSKQLIYRILALMLEMVNHDMYQGNMML